MDIQAYLNQAFVTGLHELANHPEIKEAVNKFTKIGGLDPSCFLEIVCKYLKEGRTLDTFQYNPILHCIISDLAKLETEVACQSELVADEIDRMFEAKYNESSLTKDDDPSFSAKVKEFKRRYYDWGVEGTVTEHDHAPIYMAYDEALAEYKLDHPTEYFGGNSDENYGRLVYATRPLFKICERILLKRFGLL